MKKLYMTDDTNIDVPTVRMKCDCGWEEKAYATRETRQRAENHLRTKHKEGLLIYQGHQIHVKKGDRGSFT